MKTTIEVNGEQIEVDLDNLSEEELKAYNIKVNNGEEGFIRPKRRALRKIRGILPLICIMAFFLCGFLTSFIYFGCVGSSLPCCLFSSCGMRWLL